MAQQTITKQECKQKCDVVIKKADELILKLDTKTKRQGEHITELDRRLKESWENYDSLEKELDEWHRRPEITIPMGIILGMFIQSRVLR